MSAGAALGVPQALATPTVTPVFSTSGLTTTTTCTAGVEPIADSCARTSLQFIITSVAGDSGTASFTFTLPSKLVLSTPYIESNTEPGTCTNAAAATSGTAGGTTITVTNVNYPVAGTCTVFVDVVATAGTLNGTCSTPPDVDDAGLTLAPSNFTSATNITPNPLTSACLAVGTFPTAMPPAVRENFGKQGNPQDLNCTANDVSAGNIIVTNTSQCIFGQPVTLNLTANITTTSTQRNDIGIFFSGDGNSLQLLPQHGGATFASPVILTTPVTQGAAQVADLEAGPGDVCLDTTSGVITGYPLGTIQVTCTPDPATGFVRLVSLVTWNQNTSNTDCGGPQDLNTGTTSKCTTSTTPTPVAVVGQINITKVTVPTPDVGATAFNFSAPNTTTFDGSVFSPTPDPFTLVDQQTANLQTQPLTAGGTSYTITETPNPDYTLSSIVCTDSGGLPANFATVDLAQGTVTATMSTANGILNCTYTNTRKPTTVTVTKTWVTAVPNDTTTLGISSSGTLTNNTPGTSTAPSTTTPATAVATAGDTITVSEVLGVGNLGSYTTALACVQSDQTPVTVVNNSFTMPARSVTCTFTNTGATAGVTLTKVWANAVNGDTTTLLITGSQVSGAVNGTSTAPATTTPATATAVSGSTVNLSETLGGANAGAYTQSLACLSNGNPVTVTSGSITMPTTAVTCTLTNTGSATGVSLTKVWVNAVNGDTAALAISGPQVSNVVPGDSTAPATTTNATADAVAGTLVTLSETLGGANLGSYTTALACTSGGSPVTVTNNSFTMPGAPVNCVFTNTGAVAAVSLTKAWVNAVIGDSVTSLTISGAQVSGATVGGSTATSANTGNTTPATATAVAGSTVSLAEVLNGANLGTYSPSLACTTNGTPVTVTNGSFTMPATAVTCTFTNAGAAAGVTLTKAWADAVIGDTTALSITGAQVSGAVGGTSTVTGTNTGNTTPATATAIAGSTVTLSEVLGAGNKGAYTPTLVCSTNGTPIPVTTSFTMPATPVVCTFTNTGVAAGVALTKAWANAVINDTTALSITGAQVSGAVGGTSTATSANAGNTTPASATAVAGSTVSVAEVLGAGNLGTYAQGVACTAGGSPVTVTNGSFTMPAVAVNCTITNTGTAAVVTLTKVWAQSVTGDTTTLTISGTQVSGAVGGTSTAPATTTPATATAVTGSTVNLAEQLGAGNVGSYNTAIACTSNGNPITVTNNSITMPATAVTCTFTNTGINAGVTLTKVWANATVGDTTTLSITGPQVTGAVAGSSTAPGTTTNATATAAIGSTVTLNETLGGANKGVYTTTLACTTNGNPVTVANNSFTMPATAVTCTFTNTQAATTVTLTKVFTGAANGNAVSLTIAGGSGAAATAGSATVGGATTPATAGVLPGDTITLTEGFTVGLSANYNATLSCSNASGQLTYTNGALTGSLTIVAADVGKTIACTFTNAGKATLTKAFAPTTINVGGTTVLTFTITNPAANNPAQQFSFTDTLPAGLQIASTPGVVNNCGATVGATAGGTTITVTNGTVAASTASPTSCTIQVNVTNAPLQSNPTCPAANFTNTSGSIGGVVNLINGVQDSCVVVNPLTPTLTKGFNPTSINIGGIAQLIFTVTNPAGNPAVSNIGFTDTLPSGLMLANSTVSGTCANAAAATSVPVPGSTITVTALQVPAGPSTCTVVVNVTNQQGQANPSCSGNPPAFTNTAGNVTVTNVTNGIQPSCLVVNTFSFTITKTPSVSIAPPGSPLSFTIVITNNGPAPADNSIITDPAIANYTVNDPVVCLGTTGGATCPTPLTVAALQGGGMTVATFPAGATITLRIDGTSSLQSGTLINTVTVSPPAGIPGVASASASAVVGAETRVIPTLSVGSLIVLMLALAGLAAVVYRRRATE